MSNSIHSYLLRSFVVLWALLLPIAVSAASVQVLGAKLSDPAGRLQLSIYSGAPAFSTIHIGDAFQNLADGTYLVDDVRRKANYGEFTISAGQVTTVTGALQLDSPNVIDFDLGQLAKVELDGSDLTIPADFMLTSSGPVGSQRGLWAMYLPPTRPGESFLVTDRGGAAIFGAYEVDSSLQVVPTVPGPAFSGDALVVNNNLITFDRGKLAEITIGKGDLTIPPDLMKMALRETTGDGRTISDGWTFYLPPTVSGNFFADRWITDRQGHGIYGTLQIATDLMAFEPAGVQDSSESLIITELIPPNEGSRTFDVAFDHSKLAEVALNNTALSSPPGLIVTLLDQVLGATADDLTLRVPQSLTTTNPPRPYRIQTWGRVDYGTFWVDPDLSVSPTGALEISSTNANRTELKFDFCQINQLQITPAAGARTKVEFVHLNFQNSEYMVAIPDGTYTVQIDDGASVTSHQVDLSDPQNPVLPQSPFATFALLPCDTDGDGVPDDADICPGGDDNIDSDSDLVPDFCDACPLDPDNDADGDGVCGDVDSCPGADDSIDTDGDGFPDGDPLAIPPIFCDVCPFDPVNDADDDGVCGDVDNCPLVSNSNQADADGDLVGDVCDADDDNDGICDGSSDDVGCNAGPDNCPLDPNFDQADFDNDGEGDVCDLDDDADGIIDADDACPMTLPGNVVDTTGCAIADLCPCENDWKNHGSYVKCVAHAANDFFDLGLITQSEHGDIVSQAGNSDCGRR